MDFNIYLIIIHLFVLLIIYGIHKIDYNMSWMSQL